MFCNQCGKEIVEGTAFCTNCGCPVGASGSGSSVQTGPEDSGKSKKEKKRKEKKQKGKKGKGILVFVLILLILGAGAGAGAYWYLNSDEFLISKNMKLAEECFAEEEYDQAAEYYQEALKLDKGLTEAYLGAADTLAADENYEEAVDILKKGIKKAGKNEDDEEMLSEKLVEIYCLWADYYVENDQQQEAYALLETAAAELEEPELEDKLAEIRGGGTPDGQMAEGGESPADAQEEAAGKESAAEDNTSTPESSQQPEATLTPEPTQPPEEPDSDEEDTAIHRYELIVEDVTWLEAWQACRKKGGYLVHINSQEEFDAILEQINDEDKKKIIFWLGALRQGDSTEYHWVKNDGSVSEEIINGNPVYDGFWLEGEPSYVSEGELELYLNMFYRSDVKSFVWNDAPGDLIEIVSSYAGKIGYICEYED